MILIATMYPDIEGIVNQKSGKEFSITEFLRKVQLKY
jgi:hypothetical protein